MEALVDISTIKESNTDSIKALKHLPFGQRMLRAGFNNITYKDLMDRLGCTVFNEREEKRASRKCRLLAYMANKIIDKQNTENANRSIFKKILMPKKHIKPVRVFEMWDVDDDYEYYEIAQKKKFGHSGFYCTGTIKKTKKGKYAHLELYDQWEPEFHTLESYAEAKIPARCIKSIQTAKRLGAKYLWVVEPTVKVPDPIIIATRSNEMEEGWDGPKMPYHEVDLWEK